MVATYAEETAVFNRTLHETKNKFLRVHVQINVTKIGNILGIFDNLYLILYNYVLIIK